MRSTEATKQKVIRKSTTMKKIFDHTAFKAIRWIFVLGLAIISSMLTAIALTMYLNHERDPNSPWRDFEFLVVVLGGLAAAALVTWLLDWLLKQIEKFTQ